MKDSDDETEDTVLLEYGFDDVRIKPFQIKLKDIVEWSQGYKCPESIVC